MRTINIFIALSLPLIGFGQEQVRVSPLSVATAHYQDTYIKITYSRPNKKGRKIFGGLVPWGQVWRTGANEATEITLTGDIEMNGQELKEGTYSLFTIPNRDKWTIILNSDLGLWGSYNYNTKKDVLRFDVPVRPTDRIYEAFTITIKPKEDKADILLMWDNTQVAIPIQYLALASKP